MRPIQQTLFQTRFDVLYAEKGVVNQMKILVVDGQGGSIGRQIIEQMKSFPQEVDLVAVGTNSIATAAMLKAGPCRGATGENAVIVNARDADYIVGPIGILAADSLLGELTPAMATAIGQSPAQKILIPTGRCSNFVVGVQTLNRSELVQLAIREIMDLEGLVSR